MSRYSTRREREIARCSLASYKLEAGELQKATIVYGPGKGTLHPQGPLPRDGQAGTAWEVLILSASPEAVNVFLADHAPPFHDPFAGGGALPLEAQRLGLEAHASDLNPVAVVINKGMIEIPPALRRSASDQRGGVQGQTASK